ncbi:HAMP domain-containing protein [Rhodobacteraceae bacterium CCMM004]|nr:HAMP domain-containing protein [Rhodobacteraceae bacterium CCMM004]
MTFGWLKRYAPRSLYGRAALILLVPIVTIQIVVSGVFIQRHFEDVTEQMAYNIGLELDHILARISEAPDADAAADAIGPLAEALQIDAALPAPAAVRGDRRLFYDLSGRQLISSLRRRIDGITGIELAEDDNRVHMTIETDKGLLDLGFSRYRVSASNPHQLLVISLFVSVVMATVAYLFLKNQVRPIARLAHAAEAFGKGRTLPYHPSGATEVRAAGSAFLDMRNRIERQIESRTLMLSGVSHDLRTPLTRLKLGLSMLDQDADVAALLRDVDEMERMMDTFLDFARSGALDDLEEVDPAALMADIAAKMQRGGADVTLRPAEGTGTAMLLPMAVERALQNLVGNAVRHGTRAELSVAISERAVVLSVEDDGPGIAKSAREDATKPFVRLDTARNQDRGGGVGLGLAIATDIARQHGGALRLGESARLGGLRADLVLPR